MIGIVIGMLCLVALFKVARWGRYRHAYGPYGGWGGGWHGRGWHGRHHRDHHGCGDAGAPDDRGPGDEDGFDPSRIGRHGFMRFVFEQLDTTPGQEKVIQASLGQLRDTLRELKGEKDATRRDVASAVRSEAFDASLLAGTFARHDAAIGRAREAFLEAFGKIHEALDPSQRDKLAGWIDRAGGFRRVFGGPYRWM